MQYNFGLQYSLGKDYAIESNYVGTLGRKLIGIENRNTFDGRISGAGSSLRPNQVFNNDKRSRQLLRQQLQRLRSDSAQAVQSWAVASTPTTTYAKSLDELSDVFRTRNGANISATDVQNLKLDYGPSDFDIRHRFVVSYNYDLPIFRGNRILGGWTVNGIISWNTGAPIGLYDASAMPTKMAYAATAPSSSGREVLRVRLSTRRVTACISSWIRHSSTSRRLVSTPAVNDGFWCNSNVSRGAIPGPKFANVDFGVSKTFKITSGWASDSMPTSSTC